MTSLILTLFPLFTNGLMNKCPFSSQGTPPSKRAYAPSVREYNHALNDLPLRMVFDDIYEVMSNSQSCWAADEFNGEQSYGPLFIRLAWHCSGTYRTTDGRGGCAGGRQRFPPESEWEDNTNLDKARALLTPIKNKYGDSLSWGDLFVFAGDAAIMKMGGPVSDVCYGRVDDEDGTNSEPLDPSEETPCPEPGNCPPPLGMSTPGLIYVNPEGFMGNPDPAATARHMREVFERMGMDDVETVALSGGGHTFGKAHGACPEGHGPGPDEQPYHPWPGLCGSGQGKDTFTSGLEGQWTSFPLKWDNEFFQLLRDGEYELVTGAGGKHQWKNKDNGLMMLTTDLALMHDEKYKEIVEDFADDIQLLNAEFSKAWKKLTTNGGHWAVNGGCTDAQHLYPTSYH